LHAYLQTFVGKSQTDGSTVRKEICKKNMSNSQTFFDARIEHIENAGMQRTFGEIKKYFKYLLTPSHN